MTVPHETRTLAPASVPAAITTLRVRGLRVSSARRLVLEALFAAEGPVTADVIAAGLDGRFPSSDLASVYRNLDTLEEIGLVRHFHVAHGAGLYALATPHQHGYAACESCGAPPAARLRHRRAGRGRAARGLRLRAAARPLPDRRPLPGVLTMHIPDGFLAPEVAAVCAVPGDRRRRLRAAAREPRPRRAARPAARRHRRVRVRGADAQLPGRRRHQRPLPRRRAGGDPARAVAGLPRDGGRARRRSRSCSPTAASPRSGRTSSTWA